MDLLDRFVRGDLEAFELLFRQFHRDVYGWVVRLTRDPSAAEDLTVEVFWRIYRAHARFDATRSFGAWARRIASNAALDHLRRARRERARGQPAARSNGGFVGTTRSPSAGGARLPDASSEAPGGGGAGAD